MLISFAVENFRSIASRQELSMLAQPLRGREIELGNVYEDPKYGYKILKSAVIYGANASGKSNVIRAMDMALLLVLRSIDLKIHHTLPYDPFLLTKGWGDKPTKFTITFIAEDGVLYEYGFEYIDNGFTSEYLFSWPRNRKTRLFERTKSELQFGASFSGDKRSLEETLIHNHLLLTKAANSNFKDVLPAYNFFAHNFKVILDTRQLNDSEKLASSDPMMKGRIREFLKSADTGILDIDLQPELDVFNSEPKMHSLFSDVSDIYHRPVKFDVFVVHGKGENQITWPLKNESEGTQRLFKLAGPIVNALDNGTTFVMDELNNSLHPEICRFIVRNFHYRKTAHQAQLIFTTHETSIMTNDLFRRDQIWFTEKAKTEETKLYSLASFDRNKVRQNVPYDRWYLSGMFGAVPIVSMIDHD